MKAKMTNGARAAEVMDDDPRGARWWRSWGVLKKKKDEEEEEEEEEYEWTALLELACNGYALAAS